ncbi:FkbM family methyltransferase [Herbidospora galbida]|uniref:FkbM family methyltransferase n=1 Tax=Herbidospora galbida TaxID=2575442 RepID=A0A4U3MCD5_9ACTN|nr:FkbM family methyltransferase [Herbidospora galbida]TKK86815.1 FkbM family methyltransferase [Herbidospora galbida]
MAEKLSPVLRARMRARELLSRALVVVPPGVTMKTRSGFHSSSGLSRTVLGQVVKVLRHRPLGFVEDFALPDNPRIRLAAVESRLVRILFWYGERGYEGMETACWRDLCAKATGILELGANIGYYTVQGAEAAGTTPYVAVEANPEAAAIVSRNADLNGLAHVKVVQAAVVPDDAPATLELSLPDQESYVAPTGAYLSEGGEGISNRPASRTITVPTVKMSDLIEGADLIKLDIEGYEAGVLRAVWPQLLAARPTIVVEVLRNVPALRQVLRDLRAENYEIRAIGHDALHVITDAELASEEPLPRYGSRDVIVVPAEKAGAL